MDFFTNRLSRAQEACGIEALKLYELARKRGEVDSKKLFGSTFDKDRADRAEVWYEKARLQGKRRQLVNIS